MPVSKVLQALLLVVVAVRLPCVVCQCDVRTTVVDPSYSVAVGERVRMIVRSHGKYGNIYIGLCSPHSCSSARVVDLKENNNTLEFQTTSAEINAIQIISNPETKTWFRSPIKGLDKGKNYTFVVHRTNTKSFNFLMEEDQKHSFRLTIFTKPDEVKLKWWSDVGDVYMVPEIARGDYVLADGAEIGLVLKTSRAGNSPLDIGLCGPTSCDSVSIWNVSEEPQPRLRYRLYRSSSNTIDTGIEALIPHQGPEGQFPVNRTYTFMIRRRMGAVDVWMDGHPDSKISFASSHDILQVTSWAGSTHLVQGPKEEVRKTFGATCGRAKAAPESLVVNGQKSSIGNVPWHAAIYQKKNGAWKVICGGSLVAPSTIVTAAHCVANSLGKALPAEQFSVALGKTLSSWDAEDADNTTYKSQVKNIHVSTWYRGHRTKLANDIAVLEIPACAKLGDKVFPACIGRSFQGNEMKSLKVAGWGNGSSLLAELESVELPVWTTEGCREFLGSNLDEFAYITDDKLCSYRNRSKADSQGVVTGDSGGGALFQHGGLWYLQGVVSAKLSLVKDGVNVDVYTFTNVIHHLDWITRFMSW